MQSTEQKEKLDASHSISTKAETLFLRVGIRSVTMDDIASELGVSKKTLYQHFATKESLVEHVVLNYLERNRTTGLAIREDAKNALDEMRKLGKFIIEMIEQVSPATVLDLQKYYRTSWELMLQKQDEQDIQLIGGNIQRGIAEGLYRADLEPEIVAKIYAKSSYMVVNELSDPHSKYSRKQLVRELYNYHVHGIATEQGLQLWTAYAQDL